MFMVKAKSVHVAYAVFDQIQKLTCRNMRGEHPTSVSLPGRAESLCLPPGYGRSNSSLLDCAKLVDVMLLSDCPVYTTSKV